jgi:hypothetical protein
VDIVTTYEATVADRDLGVSLTFVAVPARYMDSGLRPFLPEGIEITAPVILASGLARALVAVTTQADRADAERLLYDPRPTGLVDEELGQHLVFAEYAAYTPLVPFAESPLEAHSLGGLMASGSVAGGAALGYAAGGAGPILFVTVPLGIVVVAGGVVLAEAVRYYGRRLLRLPDDRPPPSGQAA